MFEWETEDNVNWDEDDETIPQPEETKPRRRRWPFLLVLLLLLGGTAVTVWQQVQRRIEEATVQAEIDVLASARVVQQSAETADSDLFRTFLSGKEADWALAQERAIENEEFLERSAFGLKWLRADGETAVTFTPDLLSAEVTTPMIYQFGVGNDISETVTLLQTAVYRKGPNRWLLAPPEEAFWGEEATYEGVVLDITYPARDKEVIEQIGAELDNLAQELCLAFEQVGSCGSVGKILLELNGRSPSLSLDVRRLGDIDEYGLRIGGLPSPTVLGTPTNLAGEDALFRAYANLLGYSLMDHLTSVVCCRDNPFYQQAKLEQLARFGVRPSTQTLLQSPSADALLTFEQLAEHWHNLNPQQPQDWAALNEPVARFYEFLIAEEAYTPVELLLRVKNGRFSNFEQWLALVARSEESNVREQLERRWLAFQYAQTLESQAELPVPLPKQHLQLICSSDFPQMEMYRYDLQDESLSWEGTIGVASVGMLALPDDSGVVVGISSPSDSNARLFFWINDTQTSISWPKSAVLPDSLPLGFDPTGSTLVVGGNGEVGGLINLEQCLNGDSCSLETTEGFPSWSPNLERTLLQSGGRIFDDTDTRLAFTTLADSNGQGVDITTSDGLLSTIGSVRSPFWWSDTKIGWIEANQQTIMQGEVDPLTRERVLTFNELIALLPDSFPTENSRFNWVHPHPLLPGSLLISTSVTTPDGEPGLLISYDVEGGDGRILGLFRDEAKVNLHLSDFSPNGRFGTIFYEDERGSSLLDVYNLEESTRIPIGHITPTLNPTPHRADWSADGNWLVTTYDGYVRLTAPDADAERLLIFEETACSAAVWIEANDE